MNHLAKVSSKHVRRFDPSQIDILNSYYRCAPLKLENGSIWFEHHEFLKHVEERSQISHVILELQSNSAAQQCELFFSFDRCEIPWWDYSNQCRLLAWSAGHDLLLQALSHVLPGEIEVIAADLIPSPPQINGMSGQLALGFGLGDQHDILKSRGIIKSKADLIGKPSQRWLTNTSDVWASVPAHLPIYLPTNVVATEELKNLEVGGLIRLDIDPNNIDHYLHLESPNRNNSQANSLLPFKLRQTNQQLHITTTDAACSSMVETHS